MLPLKNVNARPQPALIFVNMETICNLPAEGKEGKSRHCKSRHCKSQHWGFAPGGLVS